MSIFKMKFLISSKALYFHCYWTIYQKSSSFCQKKTKMHTLTVNLNIWVKPNDIRQDHEWKSWFWSKVIQAILWKYLYKKTEILKKFHCLYQYYCETWNSYRNVCLLKIVYYLQIMKSFSNNLFTQEHCALAILFLKSTFFIAPFSWALQKILCLIFAFFLCK